MKHRFIVTALISCLGTRNGAVRQCIYAMSSNSLLVTDLKYTQFSLRYYANKSYTVNGTIPINDLKSLQRKKHVVAPKLYNYLNTIMPQALDICPRTTLRTQVKNSEQLHLVDAATAKEIVSFIIDDLSKNMCFVAEINPGLGLITRTLLETGVPFIYMYETSLSFYDTLRCLENEFPNRTELRTMNLLKVDKILFMNETYQKKANKALEGVPSKPWENETCIQLICALCEEASIRNIILTTIYQSSYAACGRPVFFALVKPVIWDLFTAKNKKKCHAGNAMFNILYDYKKYGEIDRKSFLPWERKGGYRKKNSPDRPDILYVVKIEAKADLFSTHRDKEELLNIWYYFKYCCGIRSSRYVIPEFEKMVPGCGIKLIGRDYNIFTQFRDLSVMELFEIYKEFKTDPEFMQKFHPTYTSIL